MAVNLEHRSDVRVLSLSGELTVGCAADLHRLLVEALSDAAPLAIDLAGVTALDVSAVQLLVAAQHAASRCGRPLTLVGAASPEVADWFTLAGVDPFAPRGGGGGT